jgi:ATP-dependent helicase HrpB
VTRTFPPLPIDPVLPDLLDALARGTSAVLEAPPGAGKTTRVPLALLDAPWRGDGRILVLEPRRLAARAAAARMASLLGEEVGRTVGYRVRLDARVSDATRIEVVTEGLYLRRLQADPELPGVAAVLFDEVHERNLDADLALALTLDARAALRDDLRVVAMSATLDGAAVARLLGGAPVVSSAGRAFPVEVRHIDPGPAAASARIEDAVAAAVRRALAEEEGSVLVFLPGLREIRRTEALLADRVPPDVLVAPLHGDLPLGAQDAAIRPAPDGRRKVVLATSIAETSLTIEGVRVVVDSGLMRLPRFDPRSGMGRLETVRVSLSAAEQRRGRAGRTQPGVCWRLWPEPETRALRPHTEPEIRTADLAPLALELAAWGTAPEDLPWLDPPPAAPLAQARDLLRRLGALDGDGRITDHGRAMARLGAHPRLAHMLVRGGEMGLGPLACDLAALIEARDVLRREGGRDPDLRLRLDALAGRERVGADRAAVASVREQARRLRRDLGVRGETAPEDAERAGALVALAYPDRVAQRRGPPGSFRMANGRGAALPPEDPLAGAEFLAVADLDGDAANARIFRCAPISRAEIEAASGDAAAARDVVAWDAREGAVVARRRRAVGALVLEDAALPDPPADLVLAAMLEGVRQGWPHVLPWTDAARDLRARVAFCARLEPSAWPDWSDEGLAATLPDWLGPHLAGMTRLKHLERLDVAGVLAGSLDRTLRRRLDQLAPTHAEVPTGARRPIDYSGPEPVLAVKLQEMFGAARGPAVGDGRVPLVLHLLSPAGRPVQVTRDLAGFWAGSYAAVRADLRGRYPRHPWPEDPATAAPTARAKPRGT